MIFTEEQAAAICRFSETAMRSADAGTMQNIVFSGSAKDTHLKTKGVLRVIRGNRAVQLEHVYSEGRVAQENIPPEELGKAVERLFGDPFRRVDLHDAAGTASLMMSKKGKVTAVIPGSLRQSLDGAVQTSITAVMTAFGGNDSKKKHLLTGGEPFLQVLGISDKNGRVHDKRQAKFRQICRFSELVMEQNAHLPKNGTLYIADLCCGKSYLSFAVYHCLTALAGREVQMVCMDLKQSVMDFCADAAKKLAYTGMQFICGDIADYHPNRPPDMVISLHACDTATDIVLDFAASWRAAVILSTPCCQRQLSRDLDCAPPSLYRRPSDPAAQIL